MRTCSQAVRTVFRTEREFVRFIEIHFKFVKIISINLYNLYISIKNRYKFMFKHFYMLLRFFMLLHIIMLLHISIFLATNKESPQCCVLINREGEASLMFVIFYVYF